MIAKRLIDASQNRKKKKLLGAAIELVGKGTNSAVDLGSSSRLRNPFSATELYGVDLQAVSDDRVKQADLVTEPLPFGTNALDAVTAHDFVEHVPRLIYLEKSPMYPFINLMNEIWRVLRNGGAFYSVTPAYPSPRAFQDPTHVNFITNQTFPKYFAGRCLAQDYGFIGRFDLLYQERIKEHLHTILVRSG